MSISIIKDSIKKSKGKVRKSSSFAPILEEGNKALSFKKDFLSPTVRTSGNLLKTHLGDNSTDSKNDNKSDNPFALPNQIPDNDTDDNSTVKSIIEPTNPSLDTKKNKTQKGAEKIKASDKTTKPKNQTLKEDSSEKDTTGKKTSSNGEGELVESVEKKENPEKKEEKKKSPLEKIKQRFTVLQSSNTSFQPFSKNPNSEKRKKEEKKASFANNTLSEFVKDKATKAQIALNLAENVSPTIEPDIASGKEQISSMLAAQKAVLSQKIKKDRQQIYGQSQRNISSINADYDKSVNFIKLETKTQKKAINQIYKLAGKATTLFEKAHFLRLLLLYNKTKSDFKQAGKDAGKYAKDQAETKAEGYESQLKHESDGYLDGPYTDNKLKARAKAARGVGAAYDEGLQEEAVKMADELDAGYVKEKDVIRKELTTKYQEALGQIQHTNFTNLETAQSKSIERATKAKDALTKSTLKARSKSLNALKAIEDTANSDLESAAASFQKSLEENSLELTSHLVKGTEAGLKGLASLLESIINNSKNTDAPDTKELEEKLANANAMADNSLTNTLSVINQGIDKIKNNIQTQVTEAENTFNSMVTNTSSQSETIKTESLKSLNELKKGSIKTYKMLRDNHKKTSDSIGKSAITALVNTPLDMLKNLSKAYDSTKKGMEKNSKDLLKGLKKVVDQKMPAVINTEADKAAAKVKPRWKKVLMVLAIIIVIIILVAVIIVTGGTGLAGVVAIGALVGGVLGASITIGINIATGRDPFEGAFEAFFKGVAVGALSAAFTFALASGVAVVAGTGAAAGATGLTGATGYFVGVGIEFMGDIAVDLVMGNEITWTSIGLSFAFSLIPGGGGSGAVKDGIQAGVKTNVKKQLKEGIEDNISKQVKEGIQNNVQKSVKEGISDSVKKETKQAAGEAVEKEFKKKSKEVVETTAKKEAKDSVEDIAKKEVKDSAGDAAKKESKDAVEDAAKKETKGAAEDAAKKEAKDSAEDAAKKESKDAVEDAAKKETKGAAEDAAKKETKDSAEDAAKKESKDAAEDAAKKETKGAAEDAAKKEAKDSAEDAAKKESKDAAEDAAKKETKGAAEDAAKKEAKDSAEDAAKKESKDAAEDAAKKETKGAAEDAAKKEAKDSAEDAAKKESKDAAEDAAKKEAKDSAEDAAKKEAKDSAEDAAKKEAKDSAEDAAKKEAKDSAEDAAKKEAKEAAEDAAKKEAKEAAEEAAKKEAKEAAEDAAKKEAKETAEEKAERLLREEYENLTAKELKRIQRALRSWPGFATGKKYWKQRLNVHKILKNGYIKPNQLRTIMDNMKRFSVGSNGTQMLENLLKLSQKRIRGSKQIIGDLIKGRNFMKGADWVLRYVNKNNMWDNIKRFEFPVNKLGELFRRIDIFGKNGVLYQLKSWKDFYKRTFLKQFKKDMEITRGDLDKIKWVFDNINTNLTKKEIMDQMREAIKNDPTIRAGLKRKIYKKLNDIVIFGA